jgi:hypothetical protein
MLVLDLNLDLARTLQLESVPCAKHRRLMYILLEARAMSLDSMVRCEPLLMSAFPLSCLIFDHRLWPD